MACLTTDLAFIHIIHTLIKLLSIADGVGGWVKHSSHNYPTPNAPFTRCLYALLFREIVETPSLPTKLSFGQHLKHPSPFYQRKEST